MFLEHKQEKASSVHTEDEFYFFSFSQLGFWHLRDSSSEREKKT